MCGICGMINDTRTEIIDGMLKRIIHRGPDGQGYIKEGDALLGNVRLSIIDNEGGKQPFTSNSGKTTIVYNGEIYGYKKLRKKLKEKGYSFRSRSDTEVILALYETYGMDFLKHLNGMFSFILYDKEKNIYLIVRDQVGIKPLVYTEISGKLYVSSEIKSFYSIPEWQAECDINAWHSFMNVRFTPSPFTLFKNVKKVEPGHLIIVGKDLASINNFHNFDKVKSFKLKDKECVICKYYDFSHKKVTPLKKDVLKDLDKTFYDTINDQLVADQAPGVYLSGGIDSSLVTLYGSKVCKSTLDTFCLGFNEPSDENNDAVIISSHLGTNHRDVILDSDPLNYYRECIYYTEEPKVNALQGFMLSREAAKDKKVMLSGLGGDELFGGYDIYNIAKILDTGGVFLRNKITSFSASIIRKHLNKNTSINLDLIKRALLLIEKNKDPLDLYLLLRNGWDYDNNLINDVYRENILLQNANSVRDVFKSRFENFSSLTETFMRFELKNKMVDDFLLNEDRTSMANSLEVRVPFLDRTLIEHSLSIPVNMHIDLWERKKLLRTLLRGKVPNEILLKKKQGFSFNPVLQFEKDLKKYSEKYLTKETVEDAKLFNYEFINKILQSKPKNSLRWHYFMLWQILGYHIWYDIFIKKRGEL